MELWLTSDIFNWVATVETSKLAQGREWFRAYEIWNHADQLLQQPCSEFHLIDTVTTLKRAVDNRLRILDRLYKFKEIPIKEKPSEPLEIMHYLDIVRPMMVKNLISIRNAVEHKDASPPSYENCKVLSEFVWYFLRSTDKLIRELVDTFNLHPADSDLNIYSVTCGMGLEYGWNPKIGGWVPSQLISEENKDSWLRINGEMYNSLSSYLSKSPVLCSAESNEGEKNVSHQAVTYFTGEVRGPGECLKRLIQLYFKVV